MRIPAWPLWRMFKPINKAVSDSTRRALSSFPPSMARTPGILPASARAVWPAAGSSLQTITSQSNSAPRRRSADTLWKAAATATPLGTSSAACSAADPCHRPNMREARPPTLEASGTVQSIRMLPARIAGLSCFSTSAWFSNGTVRTSTSAAAHAAALPIPEAFTVAPALCSISAAAARARAASREPMITVSPARAQRKASP